MATEAYSKLLEKFNLMASNVGKNQTALASIGIVSSDVTAMENYINELNALNSEQEKLKADLKVKTNAMQTKLKEAQAKHANLAKRIKLLLPQEEWVAYGITASK